MRIPPPSSQSTKPEAKPATEEGASLLDQFTQKSEAKDDQEEAFSGGFVEIYAAEHDPDDLSLVDEGSHPVARTSPAVDPANGEGSGGAATEKRLRTAQLRLLASKTYSTCFSQISSAKWVEWQLRDALSELMQRLVAHPDDEEDADDQQKLHGERGAFRVLADLAVSKEFNSLSARRAQHSLALTIQQLFVVIPRELQRLSSLLSKPAFAFRPTATLWSCCFSCCTSWLWLWLPTPPLKASGWPSTSSGTAVYCVRGWCLCLQRLMLRR